MHSNTAINRRNTLWALLPSLVVLALFFSAFAIFFYASVHTTANGGSSLGGGNLTFEHYARYLASPSERSVLWSTLWISTKLTVASLLIGYPLAYVIVRSQSATLRHFLMLSLVVTFLSGTVTRAYAWLIILGNSGLINTVLRKIGIIDAPIRLVYNETGVFISLLHFVLPFFVLTMMAPLKNIPQALEDAAINLGATRWRSFVLVTLPLSVPGIIAASSLTFAVALSSFLFPLVLGGGRVRMAANAIYEHIFTRFDLPLAAAGATVFLVLALFFVWLFGMVQSLVDYRHEAAQHKS